MNYINFDLRPSGFVPISLFKIENLNNISEIYTKTENSKTEILIEPLKISELEYIPTKYSFWEDYYDDDEKALRTYDKVLEELGVKEVW